MSSTLRFRFVQAVLACGLLLTGCSSGGFLWRAGKTSYDRESTGELHIQIFSESLSSPSELTVKMDSNFCGKMRTPQTSLVGANGELQNVVVWLEGPEVRAWPKDAEKVVPIIRIQNCEFEPRYVIVPPGASIEILNDDTILHTVRARGQVNAPTHRVHPPNLKSVKLKFQKPEIVPIICDLHSWMRAFVVVAPHGLYGVTDSAGRVRIKNIPFGRFQLKLWHEVLGAYEQERFFDIRSKYREEVLKW